MSQRKHLPKKIRESKIATALELREKGLTLKEIGKKVGMGAKWVWKVVPHGSIKKPEIEPFQIIAWGIKHSYHKPPKDEKGKVKIIETMKFRELFSLEEDAKAVMNVYKADASVEVVPVIIKELK